jgi:DNA-binding MarR family transcriptional regulator
MCAEVKPMEAQNDPFREIIYLMRKLMQAGALYSKQLNKKFNVSAPQVATLRVLLHEGAMPPSQIARQIMVNSSTLTGVIDRLEQKGLVSRLRNDPDRRIIRVQLTEAGRVLAEKVPPPIQVKILKGMRKLEEQQRDQIIESLRRLSAMVDAQDLDVETEGEFF